MTKILHIPTGEYVTFLSSHNYDKEHYGFANFDATVCIIEDSFFYEKNSHLPLQEIAENLLKRVCNNKYTKYEYEIIYD